MNGPALNCRICLDKVKPVLTLAPTPIANAFESGPSRFTMKYPLGLSQCIKCGHVQIGYHIEGAELFADYKYRTPDVERERLAKLSASLASRYPNAVSQNMPKTLEIGSNNGIFIEELGKAGIMAVGIDPSSPKTGMPKWFNSKTAKLIEFSLGKMELIVANNVFAHVDDLRNVMAGVNTCLADTGHLVFEVQYLPELVRGGQFDMIYHEHKDYHTLKPLEHLLKKFGMGIRQVEHFTSHGGSIRVHAGRGPGIEVSDPSVDWEAFKATIDRERDIIRGQLAAAGPVVACYGAPAKITTLLHQFGIIDRIAYCIDETPSKIGLYLPGTQIRIHDPVMLMTMRPDAVFVAAWNYAQVIVPKLNGIPAIVPFQPASCAKRMAA